MTGRSTLIAILMALYLGSRMPEGIGEGLFYALLGVGWAAVIVWTFVAWRRGDESSTRQHRSG